MKKENKNGNESMQPFASNSKGLLIRRMFDLQIQSVYLSIKPYLKKVAGSLLEVGCGNQPYRSLLPSNCDYQAIEYERSDVEFSYHTLGVTYYDGEHFPCESNRFDVVFHTEVTEHVEKPDVFFKECYRVLKEDGKMIFSMPFSARYHYIPHDYWRFTPAGLEKLLTYAGFHNITVTPRSTDICVAAYKVLTLGYRLFFSNNILRILVSVILSPLWVIALLIGQCSLLLHIGKTEDTLGYTVYCEK